MAMLGTGILNNYHVCFPGSRLSRTVRGSPGNGFATASPMETWQHILDESNVRNL